jgi:hypothetical protein
LPLQLPRTETCCSCQLRISQDTSTGLQSRAQGPSLLCGPPPFPTPFPSPPPPPRCFQAPTPVLLLTAAHVIAMIQLRSREDKHPPLPYFSRLQDPLTDTQQRGAGGGGGVAVAARTAHATSAMTSKPSAPVHPTQGGGSVAIPAHIPHATSAILRQPPPPWVGGGGWGLPPSLSQPTCSVVASSAMLAGNICVLVSYSSPSAVIPHPPPCVRCVSATCFCRNERGVPPPPHPVPSSPIQSNRSTGLPAIMVGSHSVLHPQPLPPCCPSSQDHALNCCLFLKT